MQRDGEGETATDGNDGEQIDGSDRGDQKMHDYVIGLVKECIEILDEQRGASFPAYKHVVIKCRSIRDEMTNMDRMNNRQRNAVRRQLNTLSRTISSDRKTLREKNFAKVYSAPIKELYKAWEAVGKAKSYISDGDEVLEPE